MRRGLRRGLGILLVPLPHAPSRPPPISLAALLLLPRRLNGSSRHSFCSFPGGGRAVEQFSDDEYDHEYEDLRVRAASSSAGARMIPLRDLQRNSFVFLVCSLPRSDFLLHVQPSSSVANIDEWRWKLSMLQRNVEEQEIISRDRRDRRDYDQIANLAKRMGLYRSCAVISQLLPINYTRTCWKRN